MNPKILCEFAVYYNNTNKDHPHITIHNVTKCSHYELHKNEGRHKDNKPHWFLAENIEKAYKISQFLKEVHSNCIQENCQSLND